MAIPIGGDPLQRLELSPRAAGRLDLTGEWLARGYEVSLRCHLLASGACLLEVAGEREPIALAAGDVVVSRASHRLAACAVRASLAPEAALDATPRAARGDARGASPLPHATLLSAEFPELGESEAALFALLPETIVVHHLTSRRALPSPAAPASAAGAGGGLGDGDAARDATAALVRQALLAALRACVDALPAADQRLFASLGDPQIGAAVGSIVRRPEESQSVARLARGAHMSRSAFAARFTAAVGQPPLRCLLERRMRRACALLRHGAGGLKEIAAAVGYRSMPSFSHAFKRWAGVAPGEYRRGSERDPVPRVAVLAEPRTAAARAGFGRRDRATPSRRRSIRERAR